MIEDEDARAEEVLELERVLEDLRRDMNERFDVLFKRIERFKTKRPESELVFLPFRQLNIPFPTPQDFPVLWAIRDYHADSGTWPTLSKLIDFIVAQPWTFGAYKSREFVVKTVERLKAGYVYVDKGEYAIANRTDDGSALRRSLVLAETQAPGANGNVRHLQVTHRYLEKHVREHMPNLIAFMPMVYADKLPDGVVMAKRSHTQWNTSELTAVETHVAHHPLRALEQTVKRFAQGYSKVIVVCTSHDEAAAVKEAMALEDGLRNRVEDGQVEVLTLDT